MNCPHCGTPIPAGSRRDRVYCSNNCSALASCYRRKSGAAPPPRWQHPAIESDSPALWAAAGRAAARWAAIRDLTLDDLDLPNRRITIAGHDPAPR